MKIHQPQGVDKASRLALTATAADLEHWAHSVEVRGQVDLHFLGVIDALRAAGVPSAAASTSPLPS